MQTQFLFWAVFEKNQEDTEWLDPDRFFAGIRLLKEGKGKRIIFTDGYSPFYKMQLKEVVLKRKDAISIAIYSSKVLVTGKANNTFKDERI